MSGRLIEKGAESHKQSINALCIYACGLLDTKLQVTTRKEAVSFNVTSGHDVYYG